MGRIVKTEKAEAIRALRNNERGVTNIYLHAKGLDDDDVLELAGPLRNNNTIEKLWLSTNKIGVRGAAVLADAVRANSTLKFLCLDGNDEIGDGGVRIIADAIKSNTTLESLSLRSIGIGEDGACSLANAIRSNSVLKVISLEENHIGDEGARVIADAIKSNTTMNFTTLDINNNNISSSVCDRIEEQLDINRDWVTLVGWSGAGTWTREVAPILHRRTLFVHKLNVDIPSMPTLMGNVGEEGRVETMFGIIRGAMPIFKATCTNKKRQRSSHIMMVCSSGLTSLGKKPRPVPPVA